MAFGNKKHKARSGSHLHSIIFRRWYTWGRSALPSIPLLFDLLLSFALPSRKLSNDQLAPFTSDAFFLCYARGRNVGYVAQLPL
ncbi:hypothetical protein HBI56_087380 [Parastagonospora nodorum]|uniref:Uncharacterized protein n=1 Tax=Phaeosphaeria nodorum (strain SN15 / ATCC MYA-4574 / FGSC 10173) TaxID=321614 RepID=A0A7U2FI14_PHANO|nr:hypothetical protein HBH56_112090 [Parastagonospora nodorum]QRD03475.1 hypothetical protein JI435_419590 [Parastagonospora nodorum SN15]KAH3925489.1 hypothetical protein HBH54_178240 [Parastagonospora nodorum]KAH3951174.1 hypothetical protein HBH53_067770 [Parastagonospora nodorum]KAH3974202.1 hypothetical protein HBH51_090450 [Parastagonospora nodorum]